MSYFTVPTLRRLLVHEFWLYDNCVPAHLKDRSLPSGTIELVINLHENEFRIYHPLRPDHCDRFRGAHR